MADAGISAFAMELMPRTRAQVMDVLSSQSNLAGYNAVRRRGRRCSAAPSRLMMTAAGTLPAAKVFVMGVGVAGLQAIATATRLGAVVPATDVRPSPRSRSKSLGAKFLVVEDQGSRGEGAGGYATEMSHEYQAKQAELIAGHIAKQDIVITTALIPGQPAPRLISEPVANDEAGLGDRRSRGRAGGNVEGAIAGEVVRRRHRDRRLHRYAGRVREPRRLRARPVFLPRDAGRQIGRALAGRRGTTNSRGTALTRAVRWSSLPPAAAPE